MTRRLLFWISISFAACIAAKWSALEAGAAPAKGSSEFTIRTEPGHAMAPEGGTAEFEVVLLDATGHPTAGRLGVKTDAKASAAEPAGLEIPAAGPGKFRFTAEGIAPGMHTVEFIHGPSKASHKLYVDVVDRATWEGFRRAAERVEIKTLPAHLVFIGDSLTDLFRGQNYVDKVGFWLRQRHGAQATVRNAGVGGDYILRVWDRLNHDPKSYRLEMYDDLWQPKPTHVFFFLGHNDSKLSSDSGYTKPVVEPALFLDTYRRAIGKVQKETGAKVAVISATSSVYEITQATAEKSRAKGKAHNLFGKPEALEEFNALARRAAAECGTDWIDVYELTRRHPEKAGLFTADGVHINNAGNRLVALEILKFLAGDQRPQ
ncbi:MAG: hypothetical protein HUU20_08940 [Pirellulales bacterium]|nr:hypothetical protein [Pirellulales bacterium]